MELVIVRVIFVVLCLAASLNSSLPTFSTESAHATVEKLGPGHFANTRKVCAEILNFCLKT
jgi:hypothetical protein